MKKILALIMLLATGCGGSVSLSSKQPTQTQRTVTVPWTESDASTLFSVYRAEGNCPTTGWVKLADVSGSFSYTDHVDIGKQYSYSVEAISGSSFSGPSNCVTVAVR